MTTTVHTDISAGAPANASVINAPLGQLDASLSQRQYNVKDIAYGAIGNGLADDTVAIQAAITAAGVAGGGDVILPAGTYLTTAALNFTNATVKIRMLGYGAVIKPAASTDCIFIRQGNGAPTSAGSTLSTTIEGVTIDGQGRATTVGIRIRDNDFAVLRNCHIWNCTTGVVVESVTVGRWAEINTIQDTFIIGCTTGIIFQTSGGANPSLGETHLWNVGISGCTTGINLVSGATFYRCRLVGVTIWVPTNGTGLVIDCSVQDSVFIIDFENNNGSSTNCTAVTVTTNAANVQTLSAHFGFTGTFNVPAVTDAFTKGLVWTDGNRTYTSVANGGAGATLSGWRYPTDTVDRVALLTAFAGGGGFVFGDGTNSDTKIYRKQAAVLTTDGAFARSRQTPTEAVLVSGVTANLGDIVAVTLTAARVVGAPLLPSTGQRLSFTLIQGGAGAFAVTWNAAFKGITGGTSGATGTRATFSFTYDGTNWNLDGAQPTWVA